MHDAHLKSIIHSFKKMRKNSSDSSSVRLKTADADIWYARRVDIREVIETVDVYGFTTDSGGKEPYWFAIRKVAPRSGHTQHAWDHERMILRLCLWRDRDVCIVE